MAEGGSDGMDWDAAAGTIDRLLRRLLGASGMELTYRITLGAGAERVRLLVRFEGADTRLLVARNAELLLALESLATAVVRLEPEEHDRVSFDAEEYKARRQREVQRTAEVGVRAVRASGRAYSFAPMNSRERRMLHLELAGSGLRSESSGEGPRRFVVLYPGGGEAVEPDDGPPAPASKDRVRGIRSAFRPR